MKPKIKKLRFYHGEREGVAKVAKVTVNNGQPPDKTLDPQPSLNVRNHSPTGFEWGYTGSGPAQLALAILLDHFQTALGMGFNDAVNLAEHYYQHLKNGVIAFMPEDWTLDSENLEMWMTDREGTEADLRRAWGK